jgi:TfoX/Sxy family transcriptional regulator of competence genes
VVGGAGEAVGGGGEGFEAFRRDRGAAVLAGAVRAGPEALLGLGHLGQVGLRLGEEGGDLGAFEGGGGVGVVLVVGGAGRLHDVAQVAGEGGDGRLGAGAFGGEGVFVGHGIHTAPVAYESDLADRIREIVGPEPGLVEKRMFGGLAFLVGGHMAVTASREGGIMLRVDPARTAQLLTEPGTRPMEMRGRELDGWIRVDTSAVETDEQLREWVRRGVDYVRTLPPK